MNESENIKLRWFGILERGLRQFFFDQNIKFVRQFNNNFEDFKKNVIKIINTDSERANRILKDVYTGLIKDIGTLQYKELMGDVRGFNPVSIDIITAISNMAREQNKIIQETTKEKILKIGKEAIEKGFTIKETAKIIQTEVKTMALWRSTRIARFETIGGANLASLKGASQVSGKVKKYWIYTHDKRVRRTHKQAGIKYNRNNAIELDDKFVVGKTKLSYPADRNGSSEEIFNCRCTIGYVRKEE
jgi:hypothetical protein